MAKGWKTLSTVNDTPKSEDSLQEKYRKARRADNFIRATKSLSIEELKKEGDLHYNQQLSENEALLDAFNNKQLKSKRLIKQALKIKKEKEQAELKKKTGVQAEVAIEVKKKES